MVLITWLCKRMKMTRLGTNIIKEAAAAIPCPATAFAPEAVEVRVVR
jgi:hypothetical protein